MSMVKMDIGACTTCKWCCFQKVWLLKTIQGKIHWIFGGYSFIRKRMYGSLMTVETLSMVNLTLELVLFTNGVVSRKFGYCKQSRGKSTGLLEVTVLYGKDCTGH